MEISSKIIEEAGQGNLQQLAALREALNADNYSLAALDAPLKLLSEFEFPGADTERDTILFRVSKRMGALECLRTAVNICAKLTDAQLRKKSLDKIIRQISNIINWISLCTDYAHQLPENTLVHYFFTVTSLLVVTESMDPRLSKAYVSSTELAKILLRIWWLPRTDHLNQLYHTWRKNGMCRILQLMNVFLNSPDGFNTILDRVLDSEAALGAFSFAMCARVEYLSKAAEYADPHFVHIAFVAMWDGVEKLIKNKTVHLALRKAGYLRDFVRAAPVVREAESRRYDGVILAIMKFIRCATSPDGNPLLGLCDMIDGGMIPLLLDALSGCSLRGDELKVTEMLIRTLGTYSYHPRLLRAFENALDVMPNRVVDVLRQREVIGRTWDNFMHGLSMMRTELDKQHDDERLTLCDNEKEHMGVWWRARECSMCHLVVYCSPACQKEDWQKRHREECPSMRKVYYDRKAADIRYSHETRALHIQIARDGFAQHATLLDDQRRTSHFGQPEYAFMVNLDIRTAANDQMQMGLMPMATYLQQRMKGDCPAIQTRAREMLTRFMTRRDPKARLLEMQIPWNTERGIALMIELRKDGSDWDVQKSIVRVQKP
ncbi:hypothetical protein BKA70DRAFT_439533 [Coprinopsis sp. MPI-PUGE-AT-0042]|nr:hypothetical protein BKA70DRAFT_439533 [Coprinopsis sp. MPI-PUGE-AT-0042]